MHKNIFKKSIQKFAVVFSVMIFILPVMTIGAELKQPKLARDIVKSSIYRNDGETLYQNMTLITCKFKKEGSQYKAASSPVKKTVESINKDTGENKLDQVTLGIILAPSSERDMAFLQKDYDFPDKDADQWMYFPAMKKLKRIVAQSPNSPKDGSLFGTEVFYEDSEKKQLVHYDYSLEGEEEIDGRDCYLIYAYPTEARYPRTSYSYSKMWVDKQSCIVLKEETYDKQQLLFKTFFRKNLVEKSGVLMPEVEVVVNHKSGYMSMLRCNSWSVNIPVNDALFEKRSLEDSAYRESQMSVIREKVVE